MLIQERYKLTLDYLSKTIGEAETELHYKNPYELVVAVSLSAQCTDKRVNLTTPKLFEAFPNAEAMANSNSETIFSYIKSISYPNNKSKNLLAMAKMLVNDFNSIVPSEVDELVKLPGVGRKTANVIASVIFNKPTMAVDTHVFRVSNRIGLTTNAKTPLQSERQLVKYIPEDVIPKAHHWLILHGRYVCLARKPKCESCGLKAACKFFAKQSNKKNVKQNKTKHNNKTTWQKKQ